MSDEARQGAFLLSAWGAWPTPHHRRATQRPQSLLHGRADEPRSYNPTIKAFATRLADAGKPFKVVMTACMRKLLTMLNTMIRNNQTWNPEYKTC